MEAIGCIDPPGDTVPLLLTVGRGWSLRKIRVPT